MRPTLVLLACALVGCESTSGTGPGDDLAAAQQRWISSGLTSYDFDLQRGCYCPFDAVRPVTISVRNGVFASMVYADSAGGQTDTAWFARLLTMERVFALLDTAVARPASVYQAVYDDAIGYPHQAYIDYDDSMVDEELVLSITGVRAAPPVLQGPLPVRARRR
jgi:hypothetical protein